MRDIKPYLYALGIRPKDAAKQMCADTAYAYKLMGGKPANGKMAWPVTMARKMQAITNDRIRASWLLEVEPWPPEEQLLNPFKIA